MRTDERHERVLTHPDGGGGSSAEAHDGEVTAGDVTADSRHAYAQTLGDLRQSADGYPSLPSLQRTLEVVAADQRADGVQGRAAPTATPAASFPSALAAALWAVCDKPVTNWPVRPATPA
jgi:hypothetical protein